MNKILLRGSLAALAAVAAVVALAHGDAKHATEKCVPVAAWVIPGGKPVPGNDIIARASKQSVVLLGETHDSAEHHRWQLQSLVALHALRPDMVIGFEMFPRRVQPALDRWIRGDISEEEFLSASDWNNVWRVDPQLYMPLFHFARMNRIPMVALNVDEKLTKEVSAKGFNAIPEERREGVTRAAAPSAEYVDFLLGVYREHEWDGKKKLEAGADDPEFRRFVESQQLWDRAMAQGLAEAAARPSGPLAVGIMGSGHIRHGWGVPHQLKDLGVTNVTSLLPWDQGRECAKFVAGVADAVFGVEAPASGAPRRPRLGVLIEPASDGVLILKVEKGSVAEAAGLRDGDIVAEVAGQRAGKPGDLSQAVRRQAPGTWLPLKIRRESDTLEIVAKFPASAP
jgi:uncharacterized iron-regulated protein